MNWSASAAAFHCSCNLRAICCFTSFCSDVMARRGTEVLLHVLKEPLIFIQIFQVLFFWGVIEAIWEKLWKKGVKEHTKEEKHIFQLQRNVGKTLRGKYKIHQLHQQVKEILAHGHKSYMPSEDYWVQPMKSAKTLKPCVDHCQAVSSSFQLNSDDHGCCGCSSLLRCGHLALMQLPALLPPSESRLTHRRSVWLPCASCSVQTL